MHAWCFAYLDFLGDFAKPTRVKRIRPILGNGRIGKLFNRPTRSTVIAGAANVFFFTRRIHLATESIFGFLAARHIRHTRLSFIII